MVYEELTERLRALRLGYVAEIMENVAEKAAKEEWSYLEYLNYLIGQVTEHKEVKRQQAKIKAARFPYIRTIDDFDFSFQPSLPAARIRELVQIPFVERTENILLLGPPGVGKTHLAVAFGIKACLNGQSVLFTTMEDLVHGLRGSLHEPVAASKLAVYLRPQLLIIDDMGTLPLSSSDAHAFFVLVSRRYEKGSMIITSNKAFLEWGELLSDSVLASAVLDRLLHHAHVFNIRGNSYRLKEHQKTLGSQSKVL